MLANWSALSFRMSPKCPLTLTNIGAICLAFITSMMAATILWLLILLQVLLDIFLAFLILWMASIALYESVKILHLLEPSGVLRSASKIAVSSALVDEVHCPSRLART